MSAIPTDFDLDAARSPDRYVEDVAALVHFSAYIAKEARRLGFPGAAEKARNIERELMSAIGTS